MRNKQIIYLLLALLVIIGVGFALQQRRQSRTTPVASNTVSSNSQVYAPPAQASSANCQAAGDVPDPVCTPGAVLANATKDQICTPGYSSKVRNVPSAEKKAIYDEYNVASHTPGQYEVDHLISLELGGSNDVANLWPEAANPAPGFHQKDAFENQLHNEVCSGSISLAEAQREIATNWLQYYSAKP